MGCGRPHARGGRRKEMDMRKKKRKNKEKPADRWILCDLRAFWVSIWGGHNQTIKRFFDDDSYTRFERAKVYSIR
jgi:hypothetical protein